MLVEDADDPTCTPLKRMLECCDRQPVPEGPFDFKKFMDLIYEMQKKRKER